MTLSNGVEFDGGAVYNRGKLTVVNSIITGNRAVSTGGAIFSYEGAVTIENSTITGNKAGGASGLYIRGGTLNMDNCTVTRNTVSSHAGGMWIANSLQSSAVVAIKNSTITGNKSRFDAGGILHQNSGGTLTIQNSAIYGNKSGSSGGGINQNFGNLVIDNSTVSGNAALYGGGIASSGTLAIRNSTISNNRSRKSGGGMRSSGQTTIKGSIISGNKASTGAEVYRYVSVSSTVTVNDFNLFGADGIPGVTGFTPGAFDIVPGVAVSSILSPLADNGGPTMTHALVPGSPAIDAVPGADPECAGTDQRGTPRPQGVGCDIGAFEK